MTSLTMTVMYSVLTNQILCTNILLSPDLHVRWSWDIASAEYQHKWMHGQTWTTWYTLNRTQIKILQIYFWFTKYRPPSILELAHHCLLLHFEHWNSARSTCPFCGEVQCWWYNSHGNNHSCTWIVLVTFNTFLWHFKHGCAKLVHRLRNVSCSQTNSGWSPALLSLPMKNLNHVGSPGCRNLLSMSYENSTWVF